MPSKDLWKLTPDEPLDPPEPRAQRILRQFTRLPISIVDRPEFKQSLEAYLDRREAGFLLGRFKDCRVDTKRDLLVIALMHGQDNDHHDLIRLALGLRPNLRNWRILGYIFRQLQTDDVLRVQPDYAEVAGGVGLIERAIYVRPRLEAIWKKMSEPERREGEGPIDEAIWRIYAYHRG
ncbi:hypothetical protein CYLTODRAFT_447972 [Cylindrobasidium torrendii FP15055 ss-10]|uniref:Uncharacterized protein n=1 Tax=Cylindrobasidium torrendii FP15055 ss-10 TaxID=1314674 RepID=A0A0D7ATJ0_9AGAR|nr:hypothetical protein CYLTODRAFT_447972 [Cylindrobasidium torrendii FP15055 ss-10]